MWWHKKSALPPPAPLTRAELVKALVSQSLDMLNPTTKAYLVLIGFVLLYVVIYRAISNADVKAGDGDDDPLRKATRLVDLLKKPFTLLLKKVSTPSTPPKRPSQMLAFANNSTNLAMSDIVSSPYDGEATQWVHRIHSNAKEFWGPRLCNMYRWHEQIPDELAVHRLLWALWMLALSLDSRGMRSLDMNHELYLSILTTDLELYAFAQVNGYNLTRERIRTVLKERVNAPDHGLCNQYLRFSEPRSTSNTHFSDTEIGAGESHVRISTRHAGRIHRLLI